MAEHTTTVQLPSNINNPGVYLTWEQLTVVTTASTSGKGSSRVILSGLTGLARPGEVLAIMGPSGCGKSTLLDTLAGRLGSGTKQSGHVLVNGQKQRLAFGTSAYVTQDDVLLATLTVREAIYYSAQLQLPDSMSMSEKRERAEMSIKEMGLQDAMNTRIGGQASKGISGGQKRRVSICIEILTRPKLLFLDEPTSGLDSAASYHVMNKIVHLARNEGMTVVASIHQPSSEVFELFDNLCLLSSGKDIYFGPTSMTSEFFAANGFPCPLMRNPSDHYLRTINKDFDKEIEEGSRNNYPGTATEAIDILTREYRVSNTRQEIVAQVAQIRKMEGGLVKKGSQAGFITQCSVLTRRSLVNMYRDLGYYWLRLLIYSLLCLCIGTIFHDIGTSYRSIQARGSALMFVTAFMTFMGISGFPSFVEEMKIFGRERLNGHYGVTSFVISNTMSSAPYLALISIIPASITYFLVGFQSSFQNFSFFILVLYMCMLLVESLMMVVASIVPNYLMGIMTGAGIQGVMILCSGFFRLPNDLPKPVWKFPMYYIAFHKYANQGYYKNEFLGLSFPSNNQDGSDNGIITGEQVVRDFWQMEVGYSKWVDLAILMGMVGLYRALFFVIVKATEKTAPILRDFSCVPMKRDMQVLEMETPTGLSPIGASIP